MRISKGHIFLNLKDNLHNSSTVFFGFGLNSNIKVHIFILRLFLYAKLSDKYSTNFLKGKFGS